MPILEVKNIKKNFENTEVLKDISFDLEEGQTLSIIGSSGSGKSNKKSQTKSSGTTKAKRGAKTDDSSGTGVWLILLTASLAGAALVLFARKRFVK